MVCKELLILGYLVFPRAQFTTEPKASFTEGTVSNDSVCQAEHRKIHRLFYMM